MIISSLNTQILAIYLTLFVSTHVVVVVNAQGNTEGVVVLNEANIDAAIKSNELIVVTFYASWCQYSKKWLIELDKIVKKMPQDLKKKVVLAKIDADSEENKVVKDIYDIEGFPTIKLFKKGVTKSELEFLGDNVDKFIKWLKEQIQEN